MAVQAPKRLFTVRQFHQMAAGGVFREDDRVELLAEEVIEMAPIGAQHAACVKRLNELLSPRVREVAIVSVQDPVELDDHSEPQPDVALLRRRSDFYGSSHPRSGDVLLERAHCDPFGGPGVVTNVSWTASVCAAIRASGSSGDLFHDTDPPAFATARRLDDDFDVLAERREEAHQPIA